jgi:Zn finger protein HypA/HybF involved in hydrogenase expression
MITKICPKCGESFQVPKTGNTKTWCSLSCANSRDRPKDVREKISRGMMDTWNKTTVEGKSKKLEALKRGAATQKKKALDRILTTNTENLGHGSRKKKVLLEQDHKCNKCGISDWLGNPITFELEHKDGNKNNNVRENLEILCPNCHSQTLTWRGRNNKIK